MAATKADKVSGNQRAACEKLIKEKLGMGKEDVVVPVSALKRTGDDKLLEVIEKLL